MRALWCGLALLMTAAIQTQPPVATPPASVGQPQRGRGGRGRGGIQVMTLTSSAWHDGETIPPAYGQSGGDVSPPFEWSGVPDGIVSFVFVAHDADAAIGSGTDDLLQWLLWNIPGSARALPAHVPQGAELPDGSRQISATGPYYRAPAASAGGAPHHYLFELYALDATIDVPSAAAKSPAETRGAVFAAMAGHVRAKGVYVGLYRR
jgi:Raf kinase inhibitor-like YbhB/YbcL family protein